MTTPAKKWRAAGQQDLAAPDQPRSDNDAPLARRGPQQPPDQAAPRALH
jgi:hypothetical protein